MQGKIGSPSDWFHTLGRAGSVHPDFSNAGGPIQFGLGAGGSANSGPVTMVSGIDNWTVTITSAPVPEPAVLSLAMTAISLFLLRRRRIGITNSNRGE